MSDLWRSDWFIGRLHIIRTGHDDQPRYGLLWDGVLDVWVGKTLWTFRKENKS